MGAALVLKSSMPPESPIMGTDTQQMTLEETRSHLLEVVRQFNDRLPSTWRTSLERYVEFRKSGYYEEILQLAKWGDSESRQDIRRIVGRIHRLISKEHYRHLTNYRQKELDSLVDQYSSLVHHTPALSHIPQQYSADSPQDHSSVLETILKGHSINTDGRKKSMHKIVDRFKALDDYFSTAGENLSYHQYVAARETAQKFMKKRSVLKAVKEGRISTGQIAHIQNALYETLDKTHYALLAEKKGKEIRAITELREREQSIRAWSEIPEIGPNPYDLEFAQEKNSPALLPYGIQRTEVEIPVKGEAGVPHVEKIPVTVVQNFYNLSESLNRWIGDPFGFRAKKAGKVVKYMTEVVENASLPDADRAKNIMWAVSQLPRKGISENDRPALAMTLNLMNSLGNSMNGTTPAGYKASMESLYEKIQDNPVKAWSVYSHCSH